MTMKVLIVDDEPRVVQALDRVLRHAGPRDWVVSTATSGREALAKLDQGAVDVVVSDMSMPEMDGSTFLSEVRVRWPDTVRVVLSGHCDPEAAARVAAVAHQFFEKPLPVKEFVGALRDLSAGRHQIASPELRDLLCAIGHLPAPPSVYVELSAAIADPRIHVDHVSDIVRRDPALATKVLQLAGSTYFTRGVPARDLRTAIGRVGIRLVAAMSLAASGFRVDPSSGLTQDALTSHSVAAAAAAHGRLTDPTQAEDAYIGALLADIGLSALACWMPARVRTALEHAARSGTRLHVAERELYGLTHAEAGAYLLGLWRLPTSIVDAVRHHHAPDRAAIADRAVALAVHDAHAEADPAVD